MEKKWVFWFGSHRSGFSLICVNCAIHVKPLIALRWSSVENSSQILSPKWNTSWRRATACQKRTTLLQLMGCSLQKKRTRKITANPTKFNFQADTHAWRHATVKVQCCSVSNRDHCTSWNRSSSVRNLQAASHMCQFSRNKITSAIKISPLWKLKISS